MLTFIVTLNGDDKEFEAIIRDLKIQVANELSLFRLGLLSRYIDIFTLKSTSCLKYTAKSGNSSFSFVFEYFLGRGHLMTSSEPPFETSADTQFSVNVAFYVLCFIAMVTILVTARNILKRCYQRYQKKVHSNYFFSRQKNRLSK